jgi:single-stranded DNA-binding protein
LDKSYWIPTKARRPEVIKEISYLVGDPIEIDESSLQEGNVIRVKFYYRDASKIEGTTLVYINGQGHMIKWWSEKGEDVKARPISPKISKFDLHKEDTNEEGDKDELADNHDTGFAQLAREQNEEEQKRKNQKQDGVSKQKDDS